MSKTKVKLLTDKEEAGDIIRTWGTGSGKSTMSMHVKKQLYKSLGWEIGDMLYCFPDYNKGILVIKKIDPKKLRGNN